jgi:hypothetical protein
MNACQVIAYLDDHLSVRGSDGLRWVEHYSNLDRQTTEGIETIAVAVSFDVHGDPNHFAIAYDAIIEADSEHEVVLVLVDATNQASTPSVFTASDNSISIADGTSSMGLVPWPASGCPACSTVPTTSCCSSPFCSSSSSFSRFEGRTGATRVRIWTYPRGYLTTPRGISMMVA